MCDLWSRDWLLIPRLGTTIPPTRFNRHGVPFQRIQFLIIKNRNHLPIILLEATFHYYLSALALLCTTLILEQENEKWRERIRSGLELDPLTKLDKNLKGRKKKKNLIACAQKTVVTSVTGIRQLCTAFSANQKRATASS